MQSLFNLRRPSFCALVISAGFCLLAPAADAVSTWRVLADARANNAVWMLSATEGWSVGDLGFISHTTDGGVNWSEQASNTAANLNGVWGSDASNVWAVGDGGVILHFDGTTWAAQASSVTANLQGVHGLSGSAVWAVGANATLVKWDGAAWATQNAPNGPKNYTVNGVFAVNATHVWAVAAGGRILFHNGTAWASQTSNTSDDLYGVWASSATNIFAVGENGTVQRSTDGTAWAAGPVSGINTTLRAITGTDATHIWAVGDSGRIRFYNGTNFVAQVSGFGLALNGVSAFSTTAVQAVGVNRTFDRFNGTAWTVQTSPTPLVNFNAVWGSKDSDVWFGGSSGAMLRYDGTDFTSTATGVTAGLQDIWGPDANNVWAVGASGTIIKWNGSTWAQQTSGVPQDLFGVHGTSATDVWAVGSGGVILHFDGTSWSAKASNTTQNLRSVWAVNAASAWAVGNRGTIVKYSGTWVVQTAINNQALMEVAGSSSTSIWAVGGTGTILKYNGSAWSLQAGGTTADLQALAVVNGTNQWTAGDTTILRGNGTAWADDGLTGYAASVNDAWGSSVDTVFLAGPSGMIFANLPATVPQIAVQQPAGTALQNGKSTVDIGTVVVPDNAAKTFTIRSTGTADLTGLTITKTGTHAADFAVTALASSTLAAGASTTFDVTFTPSADGVRNAAITIASNDLDEPLFAVALTGLGQVPVSFSTQPVSKGVNPNAGVTFTCVVAGGVTKPLSYRWQKFNTGTTTWEDIANATAASYTIAKVLQTHAGDYRCLATNPVSAVPTNTATLSVNEAVAIVTQPEALTVGTGSVAKFTVAATGTEPKKYVWRRNGVAIPGAPNAPEYEIASAQIAHAGDYSVVVSNMVNSVTSAIVNLSVIDSSTKTVKASAGTKATLTAAFSGKPTAFAWKKAGGALPVDFRYTFAKNVLTITACQIAPTDDSGMFTCDITGPDGNTVTSTLNLIVYTGPPEITGAEPLAMPDAMIGDSTYLYQIPFDGDPLKSPVSFTATGLPTGLTCNGTTGVISGNPAVTLAADKTYSVTLTATNARGKSTKKANLLLKALPAAAVGAFAGPIERNATLNGGLGGRFELTSTTKGSFTGKVVLGKTSYSIGGLIVSDVTGTAAPRGSATFKRTGLPNLTVTFEFDLPNHTLKNCDLTDNTVHTAFTAWRKRWGTTMSPADSDDLKTYLGYYTFGIDPPIPAVVPPITPAELQPQGMGYGSFTVASTGLLTVAGKLPDGTGYTFGTFCGPHGEVFVFQPLYGNLGSLLGTLDITQGTAGYAPPYGDNILGGTLSWLRPQMLGANHVYRSGFGPIDATAVGGRYVAPVKPALLFGVVDDGATSNASLTFTDGGLSGTSTDIMGTQTVPDVDVRIKSGGVFVPAHSTSVNPDPNPRSTTLTLAATTGLFSGKASLVDNNPAKPGTNITRPLSYYGIIFRDTDTQMRGYGFFLLARRPDLPTQTVTTTDQLSGQVLLQKK